MLALFLATGATLRAHRSEFDLIEGLDDAEQREERERQGIGRRRSIAPTHRCAATCRRRRIAPSRSSSTSERDSLEIYQWTFNGMLASRLRVTPRSAALNVGKLVDAGILVETTGRARGRLFMAKRVIDIVEGRDAR